MKLLGNKLIAFFITCLFFGAFWNFILNFDFVVAESGAPDTNSESSGDWYIEYGDYVIRYNETITLNGNLMINSTGKLELTEVNLIMNSTSNNQYSIWVKPGGILIIKSSTINTNNSEYKYEFLVEGKLIMVNCTVDDLEGSTNDPVSGIQNHSDSEIKSSVINGSSGSGIYIYQSNPTIVDTKVTNCYYGIYMVGPNPTLDISPCNIEMLTNSSIQLNVTGGEAPYSWNVTNTSIGTINSTGTFNSTYSGGCYIIVTDNNSQIGKTLIVVHPNSDNDTKISPLYAELDIKDNLEFDVFNGTSPYNWSVDNATSGSINENGTFISTIYEGTCGVSASDANNTSASGLIVVEIMSEQNENGLIYENTLSNNEYGIIMINSSLDLKYNKFNSNNISLKLENSSSLIKSCSVANSTRYDIEIDSDSSPKLNYTEYNYLKLSAQDSDNDSMPDYFEIQYGLNQSSNDSGADEDSDGLTNYQEFQYGTDPLSEDTDNDGMNDYNEVMIWSTNPFSYQESLVLEKNLTIYENQTLALSNSQVKVNSTSNDTYGIYVEEGGSLYLTSTTIESNDPSYYYDFVVHGYLYMDDCTISNLEGNSNDPSSGLQVYSDSDLVNCNIENSSGSGIYINESNPTIWNTTVSDCYYGIYIDGPLPKLQISPSSVNTSTNETVQFSTQGGSSPYTYECSNTSVGTINSTTGLFTSSSSGTCTIKVTDNNNKIGKATVYVESSTGSGVEVTPTYSEFTVGDDQYLFTASGGSEPYEWTTDDPNVGEIDPAGFLMIVGEGNCTVTATDGTSESDSVAVLVHESVESINLTNNTISENQYGIYFHNVTLTLSNNTFISNNISLSFNNSDCTVEYCNIYNSSTNDLKMTSNSSPKIQFVYYNYSLISAPDSDSDGMDDWYEVQYNLNPNDSNDAGSDPDNDNLTNLQEYREGTNPNTNDTDSDSLTDYNETMVWGTVAFVSDSDWDGTLDSSEITSGIYWFEAEKYKHSDGSGVLDPYYANEDRNNPTTSNAIKTLTTGSVGGTIDVPLSGLSTGKYQYYIKARLTSGAPTDLKIRYNDGSDHYVTETIYDNNYKWYKYDSTIQLTQSSVTLYAEDVSKTGRIIVDKGVFLKVSDMSWEVTTTDDADDTLEFASGGSEEITVNLNIPIQGDVKRFVTEASMIIHGVSVENGKGLGSDEQVTSDNDKWENLPDIALTENSGTLIKHVVYQEEDGSGNKLAKYRYKSGSGSWTSSSLSTPSSTDVGVPSIDSNEDYTHVVYASLEDSDKRIFHTKKEISSSSWDSYTVLTESDTAFEPNIDVDGNNIHVVWYDERDGPSEIYYSKSITNGESWGIIESKRTDNCQYPPKKPDIGVDSSNIHIVYDIEEAENSEVMYTKLCNNGNTIIDENQLSSINDKSIFEDGSTGCIAVDHKNIHVVWVDYQDSANFGEIYYRRSTDNGRTWGTETKISSSTNSDSIDPSVAVDGKHNLVYIFWSEEVDGGNYEIKYKRSADNGVTWGSISSFTTDDDIDSRAPKVVPDGTGDFHVVWYDDKPLTSPTTHDNVFYNYIDNDIPELPSLDIGNDNTVEYTPNDNYPTLYPIYDFSKELNEYIIMNEGLIQNGYILVPLTFIIDTTATIDIELLDISVKLGPDISDPNDDDTDNDLLHDGHENSEYRGMFFAEYDFTPFTATPAIFQFKSGSSTVSRNIICGNKVYCYDESGTEIWKYPKSPSVYSYISSSPAISDYDADGSVEIAIGTIEGKIYCLKRGGNLEWEYDTGNPPKADLTNYPWIDDEPFYSSPTIGDILSLSSTGSTISNLDGNREIILVNYHGHVYCFDSTSSTTGNIRWAKDLTKYLNGKGEWHKKTDTIDTPYERQDHAMASQYGEVTLFGGYDGTSTYYSDTWYYDQQTNIWAEQTMTGDIPSERRYHAMETIYGTDKTVLFGGEEDGTPPTKMADTFVMDLDDHTWTKMIPPDLQFIDISTDQATQAISARVNHAMAPLYGTDRILLFGGNDGIRDSETWIYSLNANTWYKMNPSLPPSARENHAMASVWGDDKVVLFGGTTSSGLDGETWIYDYGDDKWTKKTPTCLPTGVTSIDKRDKHSMTSIYKTDKIVLFGGTITTGKNGDTWVYDVSDNTWTKMASSNNNPSPNERDCHALASIYETQKILMFGGSDKTSSLLDETWICDFDGVDNQANTFSSPVICDLDQNNIMEIVIGDENGKIYCLNYEGKIKWTYDADSSIKSTPAVGDIDRDGKLEIIVGSDDGKIHCINHNGISTWDGQFNTYSKITGSTAIANVDISTEELECVIGTEDGVIYCIKKDGTLDWQYPSVRDGSKEPFRSTTLTIDLNSFPDGGYESVAVSEDGHIYCIDTVGAIDNDYSYYSYRSTPDLGYFSFMGSPIIADIDEDSKVEIIFGENTHQIKQTDYDCYPQAIKWGMFGSGPKHDGNGDNRFALLIEGSSGDYPFENTQFRANIQEMARILTEHPRNIKPGPGYTGYYLQDQIFYIGIDNDIPEVDRDREIKRPNNVVENGNTNTDGDGEDSAQGKNEIKMAIKNLATKSDSYDSIVFLYSSHGGYLPQSGGGRNYYFDANNHHLFYDRTGAGSTNQEMKMKYSDAGDLENTELASILKKVESYKMIMILQPCYSGNFLNPLTNHKYEENRIVMSGERVASTTQYRVTLFDKCNFEINDNDDYYHFRDRHTMWYDYEGTTYQPRYYDNDQVAPLGDGEKNSKTRTTYTIFKCTVSDERNLVGQSSKQDGVFEVTRGTKSGANDIDFLENPDDESVEFVSGLTEAYFIDREYIEIGQTVHSSNNVLDSDESATNGAISTSGNSNNYISCKEMFKFSKFWHFGCHMISGGTPDADWYDNPQIRYTELEPDKTYIF